MPIDEIFEGFKIFVDGAQEWRSIYVKKLLFFCNLNFFFDRFQEPSAQSENSKFTAKEGYEFLKRNQALVGREFTLNWDDLKVAVPFIGTDGAFNPGIDIDFYESLEGSFF